MADALSTFAGLANDAPNVYISRKMIELLDRIMVVQKIAEAYPLANAMSKTLRAVRVRRLALPTEQLVEGVTPSTLSLELENVDVTVEQWGIVVALTDVLELTVVHPMLSLAIERTAMAMKETAEREDANVLMTATNVTYPGTVTARSGLSSTDIFNTALVIGLTTRLKMRGAPPFMPDGYYIGLMQPPHEAAVLGSDSTFQQASNFSRVMKLEYGYLGPWMGADWVSGNFLPVFVGVEAATTAAATVTKAQFTVGTSGSLGTGNFQLQVVGRELVSDYERRLSVQSANISVTSPGSIAVTLPSSVNYSYDIYLTQIGATVPFQVASRQAASSTFTIITAPAGTETIAPTAPANGVSVFPGFVLGRGALGTTVLNGMSLQTFLTPKGPSDSDPLSQRRKVGAKYMRKSWIVDNDFLERFETSSDIGAIIPA